MTSNRYADYDPFAWLYNKYWGGEFVQTVLPLLDRYVFDGLDPGAKDLNLACGTGQLAAALTERGFEVTGVDGSDEMLHFARINATQR